MLTTILILLVGSLLLGPIMMMRPSQGDAKRSRLRILALSKGLKVTLKQRPKGTSRDLLPVYFMPWPHAMLKKYSDSIDWTICKENFEHEIHFHGDWNVLTIENYSSSTKLSSNKAERGKPPALWHNAIKEFLDKDMQGNIALMSSHAGLGVFWDEKLHGRSEEEAIDSVWQHLSSLAKALS